MQFLSAAFRNLGHVAGTVAVIVAIAPVGAQSPTPPPPPTPPAASDPLTVTKAMYVATFPQFVTWPSSIRSNGDGLTVCLTPSHPFGRDLLERAKGVTLHGQALDVRELQKTDALTGCHVLFVGPRDRDLLSRAAGKAILTVGNEPDFCQAGGIVNLLVVADRVRFEVDLANAKKAGLGVDAQLLRLATAVYDKTR